MRAKHRGKREFWVIDEKHEVLYRTTSKLVAASYVFGRGYGAVVKIKPVKIARPVVTT